VSLIRKLSVWAIVLSSAQALALPQNQLKLGMTGESYVNSNQAFYREDASKAISDLRLEFNSFNEKKRVVYKAQGTLQYGETEKAAYFDIRDLYVGYKINNAELSFGRRGQNWSDAERIWKTGQWEPRAFHDKIKADPLSLFGFFFNYQKDRVSLVAYTSPIYIPEMSPASHIEDGKFVSANPWFSAPPQEVLWSGSLMPVRYSVDQPQISSVIMRPSYGASATVMEQGVFGRVSYADKPLNQIPLAFPVVVRGLDSGQHLDIAIQPSFRRHRLLTVESGLKQEEGWQLLASLTNDDVESPRQAPDNWLTQNIKDSLTQVYSVGYEWNKTGLSFSYLHMDGGDARDFGVQANDVSMFERRFQYLRAYRISAEQRRIKGLGRTSNLTGSFTYDQMQRGVLMSLAFITQWSAQWSSVVAADWLGLRDLAPVTVTDGFIRTYRSNDRVGVGVSYVF